MALADGLPHRDGTTLGRLRTVQTLVTVRVPLQGLLPTVTRLVRSVLALPQHHRRSLGQRLAAELEETLAHLGSLRHGITETLRSVGHRVEALDGTALGQALARALDPSASGVPAIDATSPLGEQVLQRPLTQVPGGFGYVDATGTLTEVAQMLSLHHAPPQTYPGILCAPRAPASTKPLALWQAWAGPLTLVVNVAAVDSQAEKSRLQWKARLASWHGKEQESDSSDAENVTLKKELQTLLQTLFVTGGQIYWGRVHVVLWGEPRAVKRGLDEVQRLGRSLDLEFAPEPGALGSTLWLQTLPLGFDPAYPAEKILQRARRIPGDILSDLLTLYGGCRGTATPGLLYLNQRGETATWHPFDSATNPHLIITGTSGAGKTFTVAHLVNQLMPLGATMVLVDPLTNYRQLCELWQGDYVALGFERPPCINPFAGPLDSQHVSFLTAILAQMAGGGGDRLTWEEFNVLGNAVGYFAQHWDTQRGEPTLGVFHQEVLQEGIFEEKDRRSRMLGRQLARKLGLFVGNGPYVPFLNGPNTFRVRPGLTLLELNQLEKAKDLQAILFFAQVHFYTTFFRDPQHFYTPKYILFDEVWAFDKFPQTADEVDKIVRTYRNFHTCAGFLSQDVKTWDTPMGQVIRSIAGLRLFLQQAGGELPKLKDLFDLTDAEMQVFRQVKRHADWSSGYLQVDGGHGGVLRLIPDLYTKLLMAQDSALAQRRRALLAETGGDLARTMRTLLQEARAHA